MALTLYNKKRNFKLQITTACATGFDRLGASAYEFSTENCRGTQRAFGLRALLY